MGFTDFIDSTILLRLAIAVVVLALLLIGLSDYRSRRGRQLKAQGAMVGHLHDKSDRGETFTPKVRFATADGRQAEIVDGFGVSPRALAIGTPLTVV